MPAPSMGTDLSDPVVHDVDASLMNRELHLPEGKKDVFRENGEIDDCLFQAHMLFNI